MGVPGLMSFVLEKKHLSNKLDLIDEVSRVGEIRILVDFQSFSHSLTRLACERVRSCVNSQYICLTGIDYSFLNDFAAAYYYAFKKTDITLEFYADVERGAVSKKLFQQKFPEYIRRWKCYRDRCNHFCDVANNLSFPCYPADYDFVDCPMAADIILYSLSQIGAKVIFCCSGEADLILAKECSTYENVYIMSNDSDFCLIKGCRFIPTRSMDQSVLSFFKGNSLLPTVPTKLIVNVLNADELHKKLGLKNKKQLIDVAITCGTDYTKVFVMGLHNEILQCRPWFCNVLHYFKQNTCCFENTPFFPLAINSLQFSRAIEYSRKFYEQDKSLMISFDDLSQYHQQLIQLVEMGSLHSRCLAIFHKQLWEKQVYYDLHNSVHPDKLFSQINDAFAEMLLGTHVEFSFYFTGDSSMRPTQECRIATCKDLPNVLECKKLLETERKTLLFSIFGIPVPYEFDEYQDGFIILIGKYLKKQFSLLNFKIEELEMITIILSLFPGKISDDIIIKLYNIKPTIRCVTLRAIVELALWYAYVFVGGLLNLQKCIGPFYSLFSPVIFNALFMLVCGKQCDTLESNHIYENLFYSALIKKSKLISEILNEK